MKRILILVAAFACAVGLAVAAPPDEPETSGPEFGPGVWTTDVDAVKSAAAKDGRMICVVSANYGGCYYSQIFWPVAKDAKFLAWAKSNGIYLVSSDGSCEPGQTGGVTAASQWFSTLYRAWPETDGFTIRRLRRSFPRSRTNRSGTMSSVRAKRSGAAHTTARSIR